MEIAEPVKAQPEVKTKKVTFAQYSLPLGTRATFTHEGVDWIAYPQPKVNAVAAVIEKLIGSIDRVQEDLVRWMNRRPADAAEIVQIMGRTVSAQELAREKVAAWTQ